MRLDDPRLAALAAETDGLLGRRVSFVEESADHRLFIAAALLEDGAIRHVHRKVYLPTYGLFDERRFFAAGRRAPGGARRAWASGIGTRRSARTSGTWRRPSSWPSTAPRSWSNVSSSPGRDLAATHDEVGLGTAASWRTLMRTYAQLTTSVVVFCNRVGVDESISFWGGSRSSARPASRWSRRRSTTRACSSSTSPSADIRRERIALPLLRDERPELHGPRARADRRRAGRPAPPTSTPSAGRGAPGLERRPGPGAAGAGTA